MPKAILTPEGHLRHIAPKLGPLDKLQPGERIVDYSPPPIDPALQTAAPVLPVPADASAVGFVVTDKPNALDVLKKRKWVEIKAAREAAITAPTMETPHGAIDADDRSIQNITRALVAWREALALGVGPATIDWTMADNTAATMTIDQLGQVAAILLGRGDAAHQKARLLRAQIDAATTATEVAAVMW